MAAGLLTACATPQPPAGDSLSGRLSVRIEGQAQHSLSAGFELSGSAQQGLLVLSGPLGTTAAQASWAPGRAVLRRGGDESIFDNLDALANAALGEVIPIAALFDWLQGRAWPGAPASARSDGVPGFQQLGWQVGLARWSEGWVEAYRAAAPAITVKARLEPPS